jgi:prolyl-tRNA synthetase
MPLGQRVFVRVCAIVRDEMARVGAEEVTMPLLQPLALWERPIGGTARAQTFGAELFRLLDRTGRALVLAPTHEELATLLVAACVHDDRDLPRLVFQIHPRFRDQPLRRSRLPRAREFVMADGYSFHADRPSLDATYTAMRAAFLAVAVRCGLHVEVVQGDSGAMGGEASDELVATWPSADGTVAWRCDGCGYAAATDLVDFARAALPVRAPRAVEEVEMPDDVAPQQRAIQLGVPHAAVLRLLPYVVGRRMVLAVIPGDVSVNPIKLRRALERHGFGAGELADLHRARADELKRLGAAYEWISLVATPPEVLVVADIALRADTDFVLPSACQGRQLVGVRWGRDFRVDHFADLSLPVDLASCARCNAPLSPLRGIEIAHVFKLGTDFSVAFDARRASGTPLEMGCYGLGVTRLMAAVVEQLRDERGIVWPDSIAPFSAVIVPATTKTRALCAAAELYQTLTAERLEVLLDDRGTDKAEMLAWSDLRGIPRKLVSHEDGTVEILARNGDAPRRMATTDVAAWFRSLDKT